MDMDNVFPSIHPDSSSKGNHMNSVNQRRLSMRSTMSADASWRKRNRSTTPAGAKGGLGPEILSPQPNRHLLENQQLNQHWLNTPPLSPASSRAVSPVSARHSGSVHSRSRASIVEQDQSMGSLSGRLDSFSNFPPRAARDEEEWAMGRRWIRWMHKRGIKDWVVPGAILASTWVKYCIGMGSYSGEGKPPMFGDYEAQRHWMELTVHLPIHKWYRYDLEYWGLDYPPLTAYHSWLCGIVGSWINPQWFALDASRGIEREESKLFMRNTVLLFDVMVYLPAIYLFSTTWHGSRSKRTQEAAFLLLLFQPALLLIDFGHFQYNSIMLGFAIMALNCFAKGSDLLGAICFVLSLGFKQMALYYAPAIGTYLLAKCLYLRWSPGIMLFNRLALTTILSFTLLFLPFLPPFAPLNAVVQVIIRVFPFARGLFEDKVANFWCATNVLFKWKNWVTPSALVKLSTLLTASGFLPSVALLLNAGFRVHPTTFTAKANDQRSPGSLAPFLPLLPYALLSSSMSFFLFSFQVHEKTILLPLVPVTLILSGANQDSATFAWGTLVNNVACFSMWPLLKRDGLGAQYISLLLLWNRLIGHNPFKLRINSFIHLFSLLIYTAAIALHITELMFLPPSRYPDLFPVLNVLISTPVFGLVWLWSIKCQLEVSWAIGAFGKVTKNAEESELTSVDGKVEGEKAHTNSLSVKRSAGQRAMSLGHNQSRQRRTTRPPSSNNLSPLNS